MIGLGEQAEPRPHARGLALRRWFPAGLAVLDALLIAAAFVVAYWIRYTLKVGPQIHQQLAFRAYEPLLLLLLGIMMPVLFFKGAYSARMGKEIVDELGTIFSSATITVASIVVVTSMLQQWQYSRGVIVYVWILLIVLTFAGRGLFRSTQAACFRRGWGVRRLVVVGATDVGKMIMQSVIHRRDLGYQLIGFVAHRSASDVGDFGRFRALGTVADIPDMIERGVVDEIILALPASAHEEVLPVLTLCERRGVGCKLVPDFFELSLGRVQIDDIAGIPLLDVRDKPLGRLARLLKRSLDIVVGCAMLVLGLPLLLVVALLVRLESAGPALLRQERIGLRGRSFRCLKLRTMRNGADELQPKLLRF
ncbi:MAG: sugar transferase, partial [Chloroflexota bacterium]|nr:sugar transferase [Chloroflexota bacterium]